jgi:hypothetical protein
LNVAGAYNHLIFLTTVCCSQLHSIVIVWSLSPVRAVLIKPPLSDLWTSGGSKKLLNVYADAIGTELPDGNEMAALELREDATSHLRYLDMAVYNNVFNPIATEGQSGATKELIRSYYEDPMMEWKASKAAVDSLIGLSTP